MRCPECNHRQKYKEGSRCRQCHYQFVFRNQQDRISDFALRQMIQRLSERGQYAFTVTQLALEIDRLWRKKYLGVLGCSVVALIISVLAGLTALSTWGGIGGALLMFLLTLPLAVWLGQRGKNSLAIHKATQVVRRYHQAHPIRELADGTAFRNTTAPVDYHDPHYAPERILVLERDDLVDALVRNRFHLTAKAAIVSRSGYPPQMMAACQQFLRNHPTTPVQVIHDASLQGFALTAQLATNPQWPLARTGLVDLGINRTALDSGSGLLWLPANPAHHTGFLGGDPDKRLRAGYRVPIDSLAPKTLIHVLTTALMTGAISLASRTADGSSGDGGGGSDVETDYG